jgi:hypothetical protein
MSTGYRPARQVYDLGTGAWARRSAFTSSRHNAPEHFGSEVPIRLADIRAVNSRRRLTCMFHDVFFWLSC